MELFLVCPPGLESLLAEEAVGLGFADPAVEPGGVTVSGGWPEVWRANLRLRGATRVLARIAGFPVHHLAQLDKRCRRVAWSEILRPDRPVRVEATCRRSKIYHDRAATERLTTALEAAGIAVSAEAPLTLKLRIDDNIAAISLDTTGAPLHQRGIKQAVGKAPLRETLAAPFLRAMGFDGSQSVVDPMCGSGTFVIEAAEIAAGLVPGRARRFAFEDLASLDAAAVASLRGPCPDIAGPPRFFGSDRDQGAVQNAAANAERAGLAALTAFRRHAVSDLARPDGPPGLVMVNPPYGARIGDRKLLFALYGALGAVLKERFGGWRVGLVTSDPGLAKATALPWAEPGPQVAHGGLKVRLYRSAAL
ncbi:THUMP domain-containing class I SAM-dependent RNA methyltransferase [Roseivivax sp. CAU 1761]